MSRPATNRFTAIALATSVAVLALAAFAARWGAAASEPPRGAPVTVRQAAPAPSGANTWRAAGTLLESCTCAVPCSCNFGEGPSPHSYCHAVYGYKLDPGSVWGTTDLSGLVVGGADGPKGSVGFLDERATPAQRGALEKLARQIFAQGGPAGGVRPWVSVPIAHQVNGNDLRLDLGKMGGFRARVIMGRDGRLPVVVENNTVWPIPRAIKAKALPLSFQDARVGSIRGDGSNANYGAFSFSGRIAAGAAAAPVAAPVKHAVTKRGACCGTK